MNDMYGMSDIEINRKTRRVSFFSEVTCGKRVTRCWMDGAYMFLIRRHDITKSQVSHINTPYPLKWVAMTCEIETLTINWARDFHICVFCQMWNKTQTNISPYNSNKHTNQMYAIVPFYYDRIELKMYVFFNDAVKVYFFLSSLSL